MKTNLVCRTALLSLALACGTAAADKGPTVFEQQDVLHVGFAFGTRLPSMRGAGCAVRTILPAGRVLQGPAAPIQSGTVNAITVP